jgi:hypothetical protein
MFEPIANPVTALDGLFTFAKVPVPLTTVHVPVAGARGVLPASVVPVLHTCWSGPALAFGLAELKTVMVTSSWVEFGMHGPLVIVHRNVFTPMVNPLTPEVGLLALAKMPVPAVTVHWPVAGKMVVFPASVVLVAGVQSC